MQLDTTTLVLEIINFLVLLWLLKHFLFAPFRQAMLARQAKTQAEQATLAEARAQLEQGRQALAAERERLQQEQLQAQGQLESQLAALKRTRLEQLEAELAAEKKRRSALLNSSLEQQQRQQAIAAKGLALDFVSKYLQRLQGPELEAAIIHLFCADLAQLAEAEREPLRQASLSQVHIATAFAPGETVRQVVEAALNQLLGQSPSYHWQLDSELLAGISVALDGHLLEASLARGLNAFAQQTDEFGDKIQ